MAVDADGSVYLPPEPQSRHDFRIAIICALPLEAEMVEYMLDKNWSDTLNKKFGKAPSDTNTYTLGAMAGFNVVLAYMSGIGTTNAAAVASQLKMSFTKVEFAFVVGVCGVVPVHQETRRKILLGDLIISTAVVQYDFGRQHDKDFRRKDGVDSLGRAHPSTRSFLSKWSTDLNRQRLVTTLRHYLNELIKRNPNAKFPGREHDRLFPPSHLHTHQADGGMCPDCDETLGICARPCDEIGCNDKAAVISTRSNETQPDIHFGQFGSANTVMKSGLIRDYIAGIDNLVAFEMEGAGVWDAFPATVVLKSACDYADSHKNKHWHQYAAASAAAGLKAVLSRLELPDVDITMQEITASSSSNNQILNATEAKCLRMFLHRQSYTATKDRVPERIDGTCNWFLSQEGYRDWLVTQGNILLVSADPGSGKSVLAKYLIDHEIPRNTKDQFIVCCYYFFEDTTQNRLVPAVSAIVHQLLSMDARLLRAHAFPLYQKYGDMSNDIGMLTDILCNVANDPIAPSVVIVIDGLDECSQTDYRSLFKLLTRVEAVGKIRILLTTRPYDEIISGFNFEGITQRIHIPGEEYSEAISKEINLVIAYRLRDLRRRNRLDLDSYRQLEKEMISVNNRTYLWVHLVLEELAQGLKKTRHELQEFFASLPKTVDQAYNKILNRNTHNDAVRKLVQRALSVMLVADRNLSVSEMQCAVKIKIAPVSISFADLDLEPEEDFVNKLRNWCGLFIHVHAGAVRFIHQTARQFLLHESVSAQLQSSLRTSGFDWRGSLSLIQCHAIVAKVCIVYLLMCGQDDSTLSSDQSFSFLKYAARSWDKHFNEGGCSEDSLFCEKGLSICLEEKVRKLWKDNLPAGGLEFYGHQNDELIPLAWDEFLLRESGPLEMASALKTDAILALYKNKFGDGLALYENKLGNRLAPKEYMESSQQAMNRALCTAARWGHVANVELLLTAPLPSLFFNLTKASYKILPLHVAVIHGRTDVASILLKDNKFSLDSEGKVTVALARAPSPKGVKFISDIKDKGIVAWARIFLRKKVGSKPDSEDKGEVLLKARAIHLASIRFGPDSEDENGVTALARAIILAPHPERTAIIELLLEKGARQTSMSEAGECAIHLAVRCARPLETMAILLKHGASVNSPDGWGHRPLHLALDREVAVQLLANGAMVNVQDDQGMSPLHHFAHANAGMCLVLLDRGANVDLRDKSGKTPLHRCRDVEIARVLIERGAEVNAQDQKGFTILNRLTADGSSNTAMLRLLLDHADSEVADEYRMTPLHHAIRTHRLDVVQLLLTYGAKVDSQDYLDRTALHHLFWHDDDYPGHKADNKDSYTFTNDLLPGMNRSYFEHSLSVTKEDARKGSPEYTSGVRYNERSVMLRKHRYSSSSMIIDLEESDTFGSLAILCEVLRFRTNIDCMDIHGFTALSLAAKHGFRQAVEILLYAGADPNVYSQVTTGPLYQAIRAGQDEIIKDLLKNGTKHRTEAECLELLLNQTPKGEFFFHDDYLGLVLIFGQGPNFKLSSGGTLLHLAIQLENWKATKILLKRGAHTEVVDAFGRTPLHYASELSPGSEDFKSLLLQHGAKPDL